VRGIVNDPSADVGGPFLAGPGPATDCRFPLQVLKSCGASIFVSRVNSRTQLDAIPQGLRRSIRRRLPEALDQDTVARCDNPLRGNIVRINRLLDVGQSLSPRFAQHQIERLSGVAVASLSRYD
jgi:hypothetical protein